VATVSIPQSHSSHSSTVVRIYTYSGVGNGHRWLKLHIITFQSLQHCSVDIYLLRGGHRWLKLHLITFQSLRHCSADIYLLRGGHRWLKLLIITFQSQQHWIARIYTYSGVGIIYWSSTLIPFQSITADLNKDTSTQWWTSLIESWHNYILITAVLKKDIGSHRLASLIETSLFHISHHYSNKPNPHCLGI
jgi:hypothetical protein